MKDCKERSTGSFRKESSVSLRVGVLPNGAPMTHDRLGSYDAFGARLGVVRGGTTSAGDTLPTSTWPRTICSLSRPREARRQGGRVGRGPSWMGWIVRPTVVGGLARTEWWSRCWLGSVSGVVQGAGFGLSGCCERGEGRRESGVRSKGNGPGSGVSAGGLHRTSFSCRTTEGVRRGGEKLARRRKNRNTEQYVSGAVCGFSTPTATTYAAGGSRRDKLESSQWAT